MRGWSNTIDALLLLLLNLTIDAGFGVAFQIFDIAGGGKRKRRPKGVAVVHRVDGRWNLSVLSFAESLSSEMTETSAVVTAALW